MSDFNSCCPFCGGKLAIRKWIAFDGESFSLKCNTDGCVLNVDSFRDKEELIKKANTRKPMQNIMKKLEAEDYQKDGGELFLNHNLEDCIPLRRVYEIIKGENGLHETETM